jgi:hypothetical protein
MEILFTYSCGRGRRQGRTQEGKAAEGRAHVDATVDGAIRGECRADTARQLTTDVGIAITTIRHRQFDHLIIVVVLDIVVITLQVSASLVLTAILVITIIITTHYVNTATIVSITTIITSSVTV